MCCSTRAFAVRARRRRRGSAGDAPSRRVTWWMLLARPGDEGTLRRRLLPFADRMRGKTGSISGVNALSGIMNMPDGTHRYFSIIINHNAGDSSDALNAIDAIVTEIAK